MNPAADPMAVVGVGALGASSLVGLVYLALGLPRYVRRHRRINRRFKTAGRGEPNRLRLVSPGPSSRADRIPPAADGTGLASARQAHARVGSPAGLTRANNSSLRDLPFHGAVEVAGSPDQVPPHRGRDSRGRVVTPTRNPASATTRGSVSNAAPRATPPALGAALRVLPAGVHADNPHSRYLSGNEARAVGVPVDGRWSEHPIPLNNTTPRPRSAKNQPGRPENNGA